MNGQFSDLTLPAWYELGLSKDASTIHLKVHRMAFEDMQSQPWETAPAVIDCKKRFNLPSFTQPQEGPCGFCEVFTSIPSLDPDWVEWKTKLPDIRTEDAIALRCTLWIFSTILWLFEGRTTADRQQLMVIEGICLPTEQRSFADGSISVSLCPPMMLWLSKLEDHTHILPVVEAMKQASNHMWKGSGDHYRFGALFRKPKWLNLDIPGNACGLDPDSYSVESLEEGYTLHPHNVDSSLQQLTFLAGLARLHELVRAG